MTTNKFGKCKKCGDLFSLVENGKMICVVCDIRKKFRRTLNRQKKKRGDYEFASRGEISSTGNGSDSTSYRNI